MPVKNLVALVLFSLFAACNVGPQPFPPGATAAAGNEDPAAFDATDAGAAAAPSGASDAGRGFDGSPPSPFSDAGADGSPDGGTADAGSDGGDGGLPEPPPDGGRADGAF